MLELAIRKRRAAEFGNRESFYVFVKSKIYNFKFENSKAFFGRTASITVCWDEAGVTATLPTVTL